MNSTPYLTAPEIAQKYRRSIWSVYAWTKQGLPHVRWGNRMLFDEAEVEAWVRSNRPGSPDAASAVATG